MFGWLRRRPNPASSGPVAPGALPFASNAAAFEYACKFMQSELRKGTWLPALVLDASKEHGTAQPVAIDAKGVQTALLLVCSRDGGFRVIAKTKGSKGPRLVPGDFVAWNALDFNPEFAEVGPDQRFGWIGVIAGRLKPEWHPNGGWAGGDRFT